MRISDWSSDVCSSDLQALLDGSVRVSATYFHRDTHNQIDFDLGTFTYANIARARASGVEIGIALRPVDAFTVGANYTYTRARNRTPGANFGHDLARRPRETVNLSADYRFPFALSLGGTVSVVGDSYRSEEHTSELQSLMRISYAVFC